MTEIDTYQKGKFKLEEWEDVNYCEHDFYKNDEGLTDKEIVDLLNEQEERIEKLQRYNKSQELEIVRLHKLADAMSGVLKELGVYDVYDEEQINSVKEKLK